MERFAINILHKQIYRICRLCGVDNPVKVPIIDENETIILGDDDEPTLSKKIEECVGIQVYKSDKMPQNICSLCMDKINDFYEYRLMCAATNLQTRTILNLPLADPSRKLLVDNKSPLKNEYDTDESYQHDDSDEDYDYEGDLPESSKRGVAYKRRGKLGKKKLIREKLTGGERPKGAKVRTKQEPVKEEPVTSSTKFVKGKRNRLQDAPLAAIKRKKMADMGLQFNPMLGKRNRTQDAPSPTHEFIGKVTRSKRVDSESSTLEAGMSGLTPPPVSSKVKLEHPCPYCSDEYDIPSELATHLAAKHVPTIRKYGCGSCRENFNNAMEYKDHNLWHQLTGTWFNCFRCKKKFDKNVTLVKHMSLNACGRQVRSRGQLTLPDVQCNLCGKRFRTQNLYEWHSCFLKPKAKCPKCGKFFVKKQILTRHYIMFCNGTLPPMEPTIVPKEEKFEKLDGAMVSETRKRGRPPASAAGQLGQELPKEEVEIPFPPPLELPTSEPDTTSGYSQVTASHSKALDVHPEAVQQTECAKSKVKSQTDRITTLLHTGATLDGNTDIATINDLLSSVKEAIASISATKSKKKKKKKNKYKQLEELGAAGSGSEIVPMVILAKATFKQECAEEVDAEPSQIQESFGHSEDPTGDRSDKASDLAVEAAPIASGSGSLPERPDEETGDAELGDECYGDDDFQNQEDYRSDGGSDHNDVDTKASLIANSQVATENTSMQVDLIDASGHGKGSTSTSTSNLPLVTTIKEEQKENDNQYDENVALNIKPEPGLPEMVEEEGNESWPETQPQELDELPSTDTTPKPLIIKIKKEKGLLNASVVERHQQEEVHGDVPGNQACSGSAKKQKEKETVFKNPLNVVMKIKKEKVDAEYDNMQLSSERVQIKQELNDNDDDLAQSSACGLPAIPPIPIRSTEENLDLIAFDGRRIKQENIDASMGDHVAPLNSSSKDSSSNHKTSTKGKVNKSKVKINPFALLKQRLGGENRTPHSPLSQPIPPPLMQRSPPTKSIASSDFTMDSEVVSTPGVVLATEQPLPIISQVTSMGCDLDPPKAIEICDGSSEKTANSSDDTENDHVKDSITVTNHVPNVVCPEPIGESTNGAPSNNEADDESQDNSAPSLLSQPDDREASIKTEATNPTIDDGKKSSDTSDGQDVIIGHAIDDSIVPAIARTICEEAVIDNKEPDVHDKSDGTSHVIDEPQPVSSDGDGHEVQIEQAVDELGLTTATSEADSKLENAEIWANTSKESKDVSFTNELKVVEQAAELNEQQHDVHDSLFPTQERIPASSVAQADEVNQSLSTLDPEPTCTELPIPEKCLAGEPSLRKQDKPGLHPVQNPNEQTIAELSQRVDSLQADFDQTEQKQKEDDLNHCLSEGGFTDAPTEVQSHNKALGLIDSHSSSTVLDDMDSILDSVPVGTSSSTSLPLNDAGSSIKGAVDFLVPKQTAALADVRPAIMQTTVEECAPPSIDDLN